MRRAHPKVGGEPREGRCEKKESIALRESGAGLKGGLRTPVLQGAPVKKKQPLTLYSHTLDAADNLLNYYEERSEWFVSFF